MTTRDSVGRSRRTPVDVSPSDRRQSRGLPTARDLADQAFSRAAGAPLIPDNSVRILKNAEENYPAWLDAIRSAERTIHFESYILHSDEAGRRFADALTAKAREGVRVRLIYDWMGALGTSPRFWRSLRNAGVDVRCFNPPRLDSPYGWLSRDHRKLITVDGQVGFVTGLCVGQMWLGNPTRGVQPWRDTGVEVHGPALADLEQAFALTWAAAGPSPLAGRLPDRDSIPVAGDIALRVVATEPAESSVYRLDQLIAAIARKTLWIADAYYAATPVYVQALKAAAQDGVDVRLLVPGGTDIPILRPLSQSGYRPLLEANIRVFEWNGPMMHAKTAVADGRWARVGSTNLNPASWLGNWELDVVVEDEGFGEAMEQMFLDDLAQSTEIVLTKRRRVRATAESTRGRRPVTGGTGSAGRAAAGAIRLGNTVGAAIANRRALGPAEATIMQITASLLIGFALVAFLWPRVVAFPLGVIGAWFAVSLAIKAYRLRLKAGRR
jgi:cardiolipin synthase